MNKLHKRLSKQSESYCSFSGKAKLRMKSMLGGRGLLSISAGVRESSDYDETLRLGGCVQWLCILRRHTHDSVVCLAPSTTNMSNLKSSVS